MRGSLPPQTLPQHTWRATGCSMASPPYRASSSRKSSQNDRGLAFPHQSPTRTRVDVGAGRGSAFFPTGDRTKPRDIYSPHLQLLRGTSGSGVRPASSRVTCPVCPRPRVGGVATEVQERREPGAVSLQPDQAPRPGLGSAHATATYLHGTDSPAGLQRRDTGSSPGFLHSRCHRAGGVSPTPPHKGLPLLSSSWEAGGMEGRMPGICQGCGGRLWGQIEPHDTHWGRGFFVTPGY